MQGAVRHAAGLPEEDRARVGPVGSSLGASLALAVAGQAGGPHVAAVVELFGYLPDKPARRVQSPTGALGDARICFAGARRPP